MCQLSGYRYLGTTDDQAGLLAVSAPSQQFAGKSHAELSAATWTPYRLKFPFLVQVIFHSVVTMVGDPGLGVNKVKYARAEGQKAKSEQPF